MDGLEVNLEDERGWTAAHHAAHGGHTCCLRILAQTRKVDWNLENTDGRSALDFLFREQMGEYIEEDDTEDGMKHETAVKEESIAEVPETQPKNGQKNEDYKDDNIKDLLLEHSGTAKAIVWKNGKWEYTDSDSDSGSDSDIEEDDAKVTAPKFNQKEADKITENLDDITDVINVEPSDQAFQAINGEYDIKREHSIKIETVSEHSDSPEKSTKIRPYEMCNEVKMVCKVILSPRL